VKVAAVTASVSPDERAEILAAGVDDLVLKPYRPVDIFECMGRHLGVKYVCDTAATPGYRHTSIALAPHALKILPEQLLGELADALVSLDLQRISAAIRSASEVDASLGAVLAEHASRLAFTPILKAVQSSPRGVREAS
jgi:CheY-like chemotaxis protein